jgi:hypothetical protein
VLRKISAERKNMEILSKMERKKDHEDKSKAKVQLGRARKLFLGEMLERSGNNPPPALLLNFRLQRRWLVDDPANTPKNFSILSKGSKFQFGLW